MHFFNLDHGPPTRQDIKGEQERLKALKKQSLRSGLISDGLHALILFSLYFTDVISGTGLIIAVLVGTVIAIVLATGTRTTLAPTDRLSLMAIMFCAGAAVGAITVLYFSESMLGGIVASAAAASIIATGSLLGRKIMQVLTALELLEAIDEEHPAYQELQNLCREYPELDGYRQQARDILRPFLTFGELKAMQRWEKKSQVSGVMPET